MFECWWQEDGFEAWRLRGDLRGASRRWQHRLADELWLWVNAAGEGVIWGRDHRIFLRKGLFGCFGGQDGEDWKWTRLPGHHEAEILIIPRNYLLQHFGELAIPKKTPFARWLRGERGMSFAGLIGEEEKQLAARLSAGWNSRSMPAATRRALDRWILRILGALQPAMPRASACGRKRIRNQVRNTKPISHQSH
jgi:hypothetical protein